MAGSPAFFSFFVSNGEFAVLNHPLNPGSSYSVEISSIQLSFWHNTTVNERRQFQAIVIIGYETDLTGLSGSDSVRYVTSKKTVFENGVDVSIYNGISDLDTKRQLSGGTLIACKLITLWNNAIFRIKSQNKKLFSIKRKDINSNIISKLFFSVYYSELSVFVNVPVLVELEAEQ
jgi:hypothetical protein